jgi:hypothetical protein
MEKPMRLHHAVLSAVLTSLVVSGCTSHKPAAIPADEATLQQFRDTYTHVDPSAKVGRVIAVLPEKALVAVGDIKPADVQIDDVLVFMNTNNQIIAFGHVVEKTADAIHLNYDVKADGRAPVVGDLAVKARM